MKEQDIVALLQSVKDGSVEVNQAFEKLRHLPFDDMEFAKIDRHREIRTGSPEVIYCEGKTREQIKKIIERMTEHGSNVLATRASESVYEYLKDDILNIEYYSEARIIFVKNSELQVRHNRILVVTGGTSDIPVAEEAAVTAEKLGNPVDRLYDVGVAGIHRLLVNQNRLHEASVIVVVAGMEGALASVVGGMVDKPVVAVPTSVGYGASFGGIAALLAMLNSCASGIGVVNIDNGFGAGFLASTINRQIEIALTGKK